MRYFWIALWLLVSPALAQTIGPAPGGGSGTVTSVICGTGLTGGTITTTGTCAADFGTTAQKIAQGGIITASGPIGSATVAPIITWNAAGQLTVVSSATITPAIGSVTGLGSGVGVALGQAVIGSGGIVLNVVPTPSAGTDPANKAYVDNVAAGLNPAVAVQAATTAASDTSAYTYVNGAAGIGATLTGAVNTAFAPDGFTFTAVGQRVLVKNDTVSVSGSHNGVYSVTQIQTGILPVILTRVLDFDTPSDMNNTGSIPVVNGTANAQTSWVLTSSVATVGTDPLTFTQYTLKPSTILTTTGISQVLTGGFAPTPFPIGTVSSGTTTIDCGNGPFQTLTNGGAFSLALTTGHAGNCTLHVTNNGSAGAITFSGFSEGSNTGDALTTTNAHEFDIVLTKISSKTHYLVSAYQ